MRFGMMYRSYFKNNMFMRMFLFFSIIVVLTIIALSYFIFQSISQSTIQRELDVQKTAMESVDRYIHGRYQSVQDLVRNMYTNEALSANVSFFINHAYFEYVQYRMDQFYGDSNDYSTDVLKYFENWIDQNPDIRNLMLYSANRQYLSNLNQYKQFRQLSANQAHSYIPDVMALESKNISSPNAWVRRAIDQWDPSLYAIRVPINNKRSYKNDGQLLVYLDSTSIASALSNYQNSLKGEIVVLSANGDVLFDSKGRYYGKKYPYESETKAVFDNTSSGNAGLGMFRSNQNMYVNKLVSADEGYMIIGAAPREEIAEAYLGIRNTIITISAICILIAVVFPALFVVNFAKRTNRIVKFTRKVRNGDFAARIHDQRDDELGQISRSFNAMLDELNQYIERVYKAEIKQKETELVALQARINPHFLYNTLEVIRMRAVSQGAKDVGDMIYSLSVLFKSLVQQKKIYTLKDELEACRLYLELFRIRYKDKFNYEIHLPAELSHLTVMKLSLQPIVENYIVHGLRTDRKDNLLIMEVTMHENMLKVKVTDNGKGITPERMSEIMSELNQPEETGQMFGLRSVHTRLKFLYGPEYGIVITSQPGDGTMIEVNYPGQEGADGNHV
ncbi:sensor histidine kinase [Paenibacillus tuaregi]|uniref:sensor histidine kinase n=1 Tax=Paenibacillus tuaregi TaxID=1816681 RepID=UPI0008384F9C|nr:sensor histidine kinase [Paenibacillus tuaregi]